MTSKPNPHTGSASRRVLVTGGAGFVGSALARRLLADGHHVVSLDVDAGDKRLPEHPNLTRLVGDVRDEAFVRAQVAACDLVLHLAAVVGVHDYIRRPDQVLDVNITGSRHVLYAALEHHRPVLLVSTSEVFGKNPDVLSESSDTVLGPPSNARWSYAVSKLATEHLAFALAQQGLCFTTVRYFNVYGPGLDSPGAGRVLSQFIGRVQQGRPLELVDGGEAVRSFCYIDDAVEATLRLALSLSPDAPHAGRVVNVGRAESVTMRELAGLVVRLTGHAAGTVDVPGERFFGAGFEEIPSRTPDVSVLRDVGGFEARITLEEGLRRTLEAVGLLAPDVSDTVPSAPSPVPAIRPVIEPDAWLLATLQHTLASGRLSNDGPVVRRFEAQLARYLEVPDVVAVSSGAVALVLAARVLGLRGKVVLPSFTYIASLAALTENGLEPVFCDVDPDTFTLSPVALAALLRTTEGVAAVLPVNVYGVPPALDEIERLAKAAGAVVLYDNAHGVGTRAHGRRVPAEPAIQAFSLHATKVLPAGEGGLVTSPDAALLKEIRRLRNHGLVPEAPLRSAPALNARMDELRAAVGLHGLAKLDGVIARRTGYAHRLRAAAVRAGGVPQAIPEGIASNWQNLGVRFPAAEGGRITRLVARGLAHGVELRRYFHPALHHLEAFAGRAPAPLPVTDRLVDSLVCLPLHSRMAEADLARVETGLVEAAAGLAS